MYSNTLIMTISIGKDSHSISMVEMAPTSNDKWINSASFDCLANIMKGLIGFH